MGADLARRRLGDLELVRMLGSGGMGEVWLARQEGLGREVAVKILPETTDRRAIDRLRREAQALARIHHPHVVPVHEVGELDGRHYYVMDLVAGRSLEDVLAAGPLPCERAAEIARQLADALDAAHAQGVIHRDVKPANVLLAQGRDHVTLVDFGVALSEVAPTLTRTGDVLGTPFYMAPEQARGEAARADARTDVWGVGATLYEMVTGKRPFGGEVEHWFAVQMAVLERDPVPPRRLRPECPPALETVVLRCLEKDPARRYPSARALADDLARLLADEPIQARRPTLGGRIRKHVRRHRVAWRAGAVTALLAVVGLVAWGLVERAARRDREAAEAGDLVRAARVLAERGDVGDAWAKLRDVELRFPRSPGAVAAYWAMADLTRRAQGEDDVLAEEIWLERLLDADPSAGDAARARWRLGRIYDKHGFVDDAHERYAQAAASGALAPAELADARFGLAWTEWLGRHVDAELAARVLGAGDLDGDGRDEVLVYEPPHGLTVLGLRADRLAVVRRWEMLDLERAQQLHTTIRLSITDVNGDGRPDLVAALAGRCVVDDLSGPAVRRALSFEECGWIQPGDLDGDRRPELVLVSHQPRRALRLVRVARDWSTRERALDDLTVDETHVTGLDIADLDGDGRAELIYAGGAWTRYDVRVARLDGDELRPIARAQLGMIGGVDAIDVDGDGRRELFVVKSHAAPNPRLFDDDPYLGPSGPMVLRLAGDRLERTWLDPLVPATAPETPLQMDTPSRLTKLGSLSVVSSGWAASALHLYVGRPGGPPIRRDLRRTGTADLDGTMAIADLDGDGSGELVVGGGRVTAYGIGPVAQEPRRERRRTGADWLSTARLLRDAGEPELALDAYRAAASHGADPAAVAFEEGGCHARARRWELALARFRDARTAGRRDAELWRAVLEAAEATADWPAALEAARALGDTARAAAIEQLQARRTVFLQDFTEPWQPAWRVEQPLACRGPTPDGAIGLTLLPGDRALALPIEWDGSSLEISAVIALRDVQYSKGIEIELARDGGRQYIGGVGGAGGGGVLSLYSEMYLPERTISVPSPIDWSLVPERVVLTLSYVAHTGQWQVTLRDLGGKLLSQTHGRAAAPPAASRYQVRLMGLAAQYLTASLVDVYRIELRASPGAVRVVPPAAGSPPARCARDLAPPGGPDPLHRAFGLGAAGRVDEAARVLAAWRPAASARAYPLGFELDEHHISEWEAGLVRLALLDEAVASAVVEAGQLVPRRDWGVLLRRVAYQQHVDSGQTHWREAVLTLRRATALAPDDAHAWYMLGYCRYRLGDLGAARSALERAFELDPEVERRYPKQGGPAIVLARIAARERDAAAAERWLADAARHGGNLDIARHDRALRDVLGARLRALAGD